MNNLKRTIRVVGAAIVDNGRVLVARRPFSDKAYKSLKWEFPGGKIEPGETEEAAIRREIREELDCEIAVDALLPELEHEYPDFVLQMTICICHLTGSTTPKCLEHSALAWATPADLPTLDWAAADARSYPLVINHLLTRADIATTA